MGLADYSTKMIFETVRREGHEQIVFCNDKETGLRAIIGMHSTVLGPGVGGCRMWNYANEQEALNDVLRLSKGMTYKASITGLNWGGGKAVIWGDPKKDKTPQMLQKFGEMVARLNGNYVTAKDVGIGSADLIEVKKKTTHVLGIDGIPGSSGDPSPATAWGVYHGIRACAEKAFGTSKLSGLTIAMQGLGSVNYYLLEHLTKEGVNVVGCDIDAQIINRAVTKYGISTVGPEEIYEVKCDIFSPGALGSVINAQTLPKIKAKVIAGAANNQLATEADGEGVFKKGLLYAPDYAINAGGLTNIYHEHDKGGYDRDRAFDHVSKIYDTIRAILERSSADKIPTHRIADRMAEERIEAARKSH